MDTNTAKKIFIQLLKGIDPTTGEILPEDHLVNDPLVQEAFRIASAACPCRWKRPLHPDGREKPG